MRYLIGVLCAVAVLFGATPNVAAAATVDCGRVTTFVAPGASSALAGGDGWLIYVKPEGTSNKVIVGATQATAVGSIAGYVCLGIDGIYFAGLLAPGTIGYVSEPAVWVTPGTAVYCGVVGVNSITTGQGSGPRTFELRVTSGPGGGGRFSVPDSMPLPTIGSYLCGQFVQGAPVNGLLTVLRAGDAGYIAAGSLPNTSTAQAATGDLDVCGQLNAYQPAIGKNGAPQDIILSLKLTTGFVNYRLVLNGTIPADLGQVPALPEILRLTGRPVEGINTFADYAVTRVPSCAGLPNTSTAPEPAPILPATIFGLALVALLGAAGWVRSRRRSAFE